MEEKIKVGKITSSHGVKGEVKVYPLTDFPSRFKKGNKFYIDNKEMTIEKSRLQKNMHVIKFEEFDDINQVLHFKDKYLEIKKEQLTPLKKDEYYVFDIIGCEVYDESNNYIGTVTSVFPTGNNDVYVVKNKADEHLIPAIKQVISNIDLDNKKIIISPLEGLLE